MSELETTDQARRGPSARELLVAAAALAALALALYAPALRLGWLVVDDGPYVRDNPHLVLLSLDSLRALALEPYFMNWSPLHLLSYALDRALGGLAPATFHLSSVLWAAGGAWALGWLARQLLASRAAAWGAALLFLAHPAHVEAVAWISSRKDLVAATFALLASVAWMRHVERPRVLSFAAALALFCLGVLGKLSVAVLPGILLVHDLALARRRGLLPWLDKLPFLAFGAFVALRVAAVQPETNVERGLVEHAQVLCAFLATASGLGELVVFRPAPGASLPAPAALLLALLGAFGPLALFARKGGASGRLAFFAWSWFLLALLPSQGLRFFYPVSDRYLYYPSAALALLAALGLERLAARGGTRLALAAGCVLLALFAVRTRLYLAEWSDPRSLWWHAARREPSVEALRYLARHELEVAERLALAARGGFVPREELVRFVAARFGAERARALRRELEGPPQERMVCLELERELLRSAGESLERALELPDGRALPEVHLALGELRLRADGPRSAFEAFERARREAARHPFDFVREPLEVRAAHGAGLAAERLGERELALRLLRKARADEERSGLARSAELARDLARLESAAGGEAR